MPSKPWPNYTSENMVRRICGWCGKELDIIPAKVRLMNFCSRQCSGRYRRGKPFHSEATKQRISQHLKGRSNPHLAKIARKQRGPRHPRWRGDQATRHSGRHRAQLLYELKPCEVCRLEPRGHRVHRHHKDGNTLNNSPENIAFLCAKHHGEAHRKMREEAKCRQSEV